jgi:purine-binding chemotaxis protein CheW
MDIIRKTTTRQSLTTQQETEQNKTWLIQFQVSGMVFALTLEDTKEVVHMAELITPPGLPSFINGFVNIEGTAIPVVSLASLMGFPRPAIELYTPLVIAAVKPAGVAFIVDKVLGIESVQKAAMNLLDDDAIFNQCVSRSGKNRHEDTFYLLSLKRILMAQEKKKMTEFQATAQKRLDDLTQES